MASAHLRRHRRGRHAGRGGGGADSPPLATAARRDPRRGRRRTSVRRGLGDPHDLGRCLGLRATPRALSGTAPDRLHLRRRPGWAPARRAADQSRFPPHRLRLRRGLPRGWARRQAPAGASRQHRPPVARGGRDTGRVRGLARRRGWTFRRSARPGREVSSRTTAAAARPAALLALRAPRHRLPGSLRRRYLPDRVHPLRPRSGAIPRCCQPDAFPRPTRQRSTSSTFSSSRCLQACFSGASDCASGSPPTLPW